MAFLRSVASLKGFLLGYLYFSDGLTYEAFILRNFMGRIIEIFWDKELKGPRVPFFL